MAKEMKPKHGKPRFRFLTGDVNWLDYGGKWISQRFNNGEFDWWFVLSLENVEDIVGEREAKEVGAKYWVNLSVYAPDEYKDKASILDSCGITEPWESLSAEQKIEMISSVDSGAHVFNVQGNNYKKLFAAARAKAIESEFMFGFVMDKPQNKIGSTGWDFLTGDTLGGLRRYQESGRTDNPVINLVSKMQGKV